MNSPIMGIHHVAVATRNSSAATQFYANAVRLCQWPAAQQLELPSEGTMWCAANSGIRFLSADIETLKPERLPVSEEGITHICLQTTDPALIHGAFAEAGAEFHCDPIDLGTGFLYCYVRDLDANVIELEGVAPVWAEAKPWIAHVNLATTDFSKLLKFYADLMCTPAVRSPRLKGDARLDAIADLSNVDLRMGWVQAGNMQIEVMQYFNPPTSAQTRRRDSGALGYRYIAFEVLDLAQATQHLTLCGGTVTAFDPTSMYASCKDPDDNELLLIQPNLRGLQGSSIAGLAEPLITQRFATAREIYLHTV